MPAPRYFNNVSLGQVVIVVTLLGTAASGILYIGNAVWGVGQSVQSIKDQLSIDADARQALAEQLRQGLATLNAQEQIDVRALNRRLDVLTAALVPSKGPMP